MKAFRTCTRFAHHVQPGKKAIKGEHRTRVIESSKCRIAGSLDFEAAVANIDLDCKRFDYFVEVEGFPAQCHGLEVHAFRPSDLMQKKQGTLRLLSKHCPEALSEIATWQVLVQGALPRTDLAARFQADSKIRIAGRSISIDKL